MVIIFFFSHNSLCLSQSDFRWQIIQSQYLTHKIDVSERIKFMAIKNVCSLLGNILNSGITLQEQRPQGLSCTGFTCISVMATAIQQFQGDVFMQYLPFCAGTPWKRATSTCLCNGPWRDSVVRNSSARTCQETCSLLFPPCLTVQGFHLTWLGQNLIHTLYRYTHITSCKLMLPVMVQRRTFSSLCLSL